MILPSMFFGGAVVATVSEGMDSNAGKFGFLAGFFCLVWIILGMLLEMFR